MARDEELARSLQALDNGLRRRKRNSVQALFGEQVAPTATTPTSGRGGKR